VSADSLSDFCARAGFVQVSLTRNAIGHLQIDAEIDGRPATLLLDTGASNTVLDGRSAAERGLALASSAETAAGLGTIGQTLSTAVLGQLRLGVWSAREVKVAVIDLSHVNAALASKEARAVDGVLGNDLLLRHAAIIDLAAPALYLAARPTIA
jgi:clan AA aspartic protease (TIGR02281 family)